MLKIAFGLLQEAVSHARHSGPNGSVLLLAAPAKPKAIASALSDQSVLPDAARPRGASFLSSVVCSLLIL